MFHRKSPKKLKSQNAPSKSTNSNGQHSYKRLSKKKKDHAPTNSQQSIAPKEAPPSKNQQANQAEVQSCSTSVIQPAFNKERHPVSDLVKVLDEHGLDGGIWAKRLEEKKVTRYIQLKWFNEKDIKQLQKLTDEDWEKRAIEDFLLIAKKELKAQDDKGRRSERKRDRTIATSDSPPSSKSFDTKPTTADNSETLSQLNQDVLELVSALAQNQINQSQRLQNAIQIPEEWVNIGSRFNPRESISRLNCSQGNSIGPRPSYSPPSELLETVSGGIILRGIRPMSGCDVVRNTVIKVPNNVAIRKENELLVQAREFNSKEQEAKFGKKFNIYGHSGALGFKAGYDGAHVAKTKAKEEQKEKVSSKNEEHYSHLIFCYVKAASVELRKKDLILREDVVKDLQDITELQAEDSQDALEKAKQKAEKFLRYYGVYVNVGNIELGGIYRWYATFSGVTQTDKQQIKAMVNDILGGKLSASPSTGTGISLAASKTKGEASVNNKYTTKGVELTKLKKSYNGGPLAAATLDAWIKGLIDDDATWKVIDRCQTEDDVLSLWDIIAENHNSDDFEDHIQLCELLKETWKNMSKPDIKESCENNSTQTQDSDEKKDEKVTNGCFCCFFL